MATTFTKMMAHKPDVAKALLRGNMEPFCRAWHADADEVTLKSHGMPNTMVLRAAAHRHFTRDGVVFIKNDLAARNTVETWELITNRLPMLTPENWLPFGQGRGYNISEDGIKVTQTSYKPTMLHYDGQFHGAAAAAAAAGGDIEANRVQIAYADDSGPLRLFVVPGSHGRRVREIVEAITGVGIRMGFSAFGKDFAAKHPDLYDLLHEFGVALPTAGLQMFAAAVWHYEAAAEATQERRLLRPIMEWDGKARRLTYSYAASKQATPRSRCFRIFCGVVSLANNVSLDDLVLFAYAREHGWAMDPFASENKNNRRGVFVNDKGNQSALNVSDHSEHRAEWQREIRDVSLRRMRRYLEHVNPKRLRFYGLEREDLIDHHTQ
jgi:hypothetical protein